MSSDIASVTIDKLHRENAELRAKIDHQGSTLAALEGVMTDITLKNNDKVIAIWYVLSKAKAQP